MAYWRGNYRFLYLYSFFCSSSKSFNISQQSKTNELSIQLMQPQMEGSERIVKISVLWRGQKFTIEMNCGATVQDFGNELQKVTDVKADTLRLIIPFFSGKSSKLLYPFSDEHSCLSLEDASIDEVGFINSFI